MWPPPSGGPPGLGGRRGGRTGRGEGVGRGKFRLFNLPTFTYIHVHVQYMMSHGCIINAGLHIENYGQRGQTEIPHKGKIWRLQNLSNY